MTERQFRVSDPNPGDLQPVTMDEAEVRQTYGYLVDVIDQDDFREVVVVLGGRRIEILGILEPTNQHALPR